MYIRIIGDIAADIISNEAWGEITLPAPLKAQYREFPDDTEVRQGWIYDGVSDKFTENFTVLIESKQQKLTENSGLCNEILEHAFKSEIKNDGLQPYRMNRDDQANLSGLQGIINTMLITGKQEFSELNSMDIPLFSWQNANQIKCSDDWHYTQILGLISEFGAWKTLVLKRQDEIKELILNAETAEELDAITPDYSDLLIGENFRSESGE